VKILGKLYKLWPRTGDTFDLAARFKVQFHQPLKVVVGSLLLAFLAVGAVLLADFGALFVGLIETSSE